MYIYRLWGLEGHLQAITQPNVSVRVWVHCMCMGVCQGILVVVQNFIKFLGICLLLSYSLFYKWKIE